MELLIALLFGVVQGATEFMPISSGGHLAMIQSFNQTVFGETLFSPTLTFDILLRLGTLAAIVFVFFRELRLLWHELVCCVKELWHKEFTLKTNRPYRKLLYMLIITTAFLVPAAFLTEYTNAYLAKLPLIACMMMVMGGINFFIDRVEPENGLFAKETPKILHTPKSEQISAIDTQEQTAVLTKEDAEDELSKTEEQKSYIKKAALVGVFQLCSILPGLSRCGMTVLGGLFAGFRKDVTVKYAFLSAIPVLVVKILMQTVTVVQDGIRMNWLPYLLGMVAAFLSGVVSIGIMRKAVRKGYCKRFGIYCMMIGLMILIIQMRG